MTLSSQEGGEQADDRADQGADEDRDRSEGRQHRPSCPRAVQSLKGWHDDSTGLTFEVGADAGTAEVYLPGGYDSTTRVSGATVIAWNEATHLLALTVPDGQTVRILPGA
ncbi:MAG: hypothetical protein QM607_10400 [Microbacterium sp.]